MAYSKEQWERTKTLFESGQYSLSEIQEKTGISKSKVSEKSKKEQWERGRNADYIDAKVILAGKIGTEKGTTIQVLNDIADDKIRRSGLVFGGLENALKLANEMITNNKTVEKINVGEGVQNFEPRELNAMDIKNVVSTLIEGGKSFGLIETQSAVKIENSNTTAVQNNNNLVVEFK